jgi:hypothetical protein
LIRHPEDIDYAEALFGFLCTSKEIGDERARLGQLAATSTQHTQVKPVKPAVIVRTFQDCTRSNFRDQVDGVWQTNEAPHQTLHERWRKPEAEPAAPGQGETWLARRKQRADSHELPPPAGQVVIHREQLRKALQPAVYQDMAEVKWARRLGERARWPVMSD